jgi:hypothetical protein
MPSRSSVVLSHSCLFALLSFGAIPATGQEQRAVPSPDAAPNLPVNFEPNQGQGGASARFVVRAPKVNVALRATGMDLVIPGKDMRRDTLGIDFVSSNVDADIVATDQSTSESNYLIGNDPARWHTHIPNFGRITYQQIYPGIDLAFYGSGQQLEHDFIVGPKGDYRVVRMHLAGSQRLRLQRDGSLRIALADGDLIFKRPDVYQLSGNRKEMREGRFLLLSENEFGFAIGGYDRSRKSTSPPGSRGFPVPSFGRKLL